MKKDYHKRDIHKRALRNIALNIELMLNDKDSEISEYDVQAIMSKFFKRNLINEDYKMYREAFGKYDCAISYKSEKKPVILYEIKTFVKPKEKFSTKKALKSILKDFKKLSNTKYRNVRCYFILVIKKRDYESNFDDNFKWFKIRKESNRKEFKFKKDSYKIRPSAKAIVSNTYVYSWEIIKIN